VHPCYLKMINARIPDIATAQLYSRVE